MMNKFPKIFLSGIVVVTLFLNFSLFLSPARAGTQKDFEDQPNSAARAGWGSEPVSTSSLPGIIQLVISAFLGVLGIIFLVLIIYSGFNWMTAQGDEEKVTLAKNTLTRAVIGLVIIVAAYSITYFVFTNLPAGGSGGGPGA